MKYKIHNNKNKFNFYFTLVSSTNNTTDSKAHKGDGMFPPLRIT